MNIKNTSHELFDLTAPKISLKLPSFKNYPKTLTPTLKHKPPISHQRKLKPSSNRTKISINKIKALSTFSISRALSFKPYISAESWATFNLSTGRFLDGKNEDLPREIASLSKIMTCYTVIQEISRRKRSFEEVVTVSEKAANMDGTSACLSVGDEIKVWDLLHALMLPSGNDAALALSEFVGNIIDKSQDAVEAFISRMNYYSKELGLWDTLFTNPHGMSTSLNVSTATNIANLACVAMRNEYFQRIVVTKRFGCSVFNPKGVRKVEWANTNLALEKGFKGVKTGTTPAAGPCLCFCIEKKRKGLVGVLLNSKTSESRWSEAQKLWNYSSLNLL